MSLANCFIGVRLVLVAAFLYAVIGEMHVFIAEALHGIRVSERQMAKLLAIL